MLHIEVPGKEFYDEINEEFIIIKPQTLVMEHSLLSLSKWEATWKKPMLSKDVSLTFDERLDYIRCMTINKNVNPLVYQCLTVKNMTDIDAYKEDPHTATKINYKNLPKPRSSRYITSELIYYWMAVNNIPSEYEKWHLNRLLTLIQVCFVENAPKKKMSRNEIYDQNRRLNEQRKAKYKTKG